MTKCTRKACSNDGAGFVHESLGGNYCKHCAVKINEFHGAPLVTKRLMPMNIGLPQMEIEAIRFPAIDRRIENGWKAYTNGLIGPWEFQEVVEQCGFKGWTGQPDGNVLIHT
jgi:hypothetical protein